MAPDNDSGDTEIRIDLLLDKETRRARLWEKARGRPWRPTFEEVGGLALFVAISAWLLWRGSLESPYGVLQFVIALGFAQQWHTHRLRRRVDALVRLLEQVEARPAA